MTEARRDVVIDIEGSSVDFIAAAAAAELAMERLNRQYAAANSLLQRSNILHQNFQRNQERLNRIVPQRSDPAQHITESYNSANESIESVRTALQGGFDTNRIKAIRLFEESPEQIKNILNATQNLQPPPPPRQGIALDADTTAFDAIKNRYTELGTCLDLVSGKITNIKKAQEDFAAPNLTAVKAEYSNLDTLIGNLNTKLETLQDRQISIQVDRPQTTQPAERAIVQDTAPGPTDFGAPPILSEEDEQRAENIADSFGVIKDARQNLEPIDNQNLQQTNRLTDAQIEKVGQLRQQETELNDQIKEELANHTRINERIDEAIASRERDEGNEAALSRALDEYTKINEQAGELNKKIETSRTRSNEASEALVKQKERLRELNIEQDQLATRPPQVARSSETIQIGRQLSDTQSRLAMLQKGLRDIRFEASSLARFDFSNLDEATFNRESSNAERQLEMSHGRTIDIRDGEQEIFTERNKSLIVIKEQREELALIARGLERLESQRGALRSVRGTADEVREAQDAEKVLTDRITTGNLQREDRLETIREETELLANLDRQGRQIRGTSNAIQRQEIRAEEEIKELLDSKNRLQSRFNAARLAEQGITERTVQREKEVRDGRANSIATIERLQNEITTLAETTGEAEIQLAELGTRGGNRQELESELQSIRDRLKENTVQAALFSSRLEESRAIGARLREQQTATAQERIAIQPAEQAERPVQAPVDERSPDILVQAEQTADADERSAVASERKAEAQRQIATTRVESTDTTDRESITDIIRRQREESQRLSATPQTDIDAAQQLVTAQQQLNDAYTDRHDQLTRLNTAYDRTVTSIERISGTSRRELNQLTALRERLDRLQTSIDTGVAQRGAAPDTSDQENLRDAFESRQENLAETQRVAAVRVKETNDAVEQLTESYDRFQQGVRSNQPLRDSLRENGLELERTLMLFDQIGQPGFRLETLNLEEIRELQNVLTATGRNLGQLQGQLRSIRQENESFGLDLGIDLDDEDIRRIMALDETLKSYRRTADQDTSFRDVLTSQNIEIDEAVQRFNALREAKGRALSLDSENQRFFEKLSTAGFDIRSFGQGLDDLQQRRMVLGEIDFSIEPPSDDAIEKYQVATELARELGDVVQDNNIQLRRTSEALTQLQQPGTRFADLDLVDQESINRLRQYDGDLGSLGRRISNLLETSGRLSFNFDAIPRFFVRFSDFNRQLLQTATAMGTLLLVTGLVSVALSAWPIIVGAAGAALVALGTIAAGRYVRSLQSAEIQTGLTAESIANLQGRTDQLGLSVEEIAARYAAANEVFSGLRFDVEPEQTGAFASIGLDLQDLQAQGIPTLETLREISEAVEGLSVPRQRALLEDIFGDSNNDLIQLLISGRLAASLRETSDIRPLLGTGDIENIENARNSLDSLIGTGQAFLNEFIAQGGSAVESILGKLETRIPQVAGSIADFFLPRIEELDQGFERIWERGEQFLDDADPIIDRIVLRLEQAGGTFSGLGLSGTQVVDIGAAIIGGALATRLIGAISKLTGSLTRIVGAITRIPGLVTGLITALRTGGLAAVATPALANPVGLGLAGVAIGAGFLFGDDILSAADEYFTKITRGFRIEEQIEKTKIRLLDHTEDLIDAQIKLNNAYNAFQRAEAERDLGEAQQAIERENSTLLLQEGIRERIIRAQAAGSTQEIETLEALSQAVADHNFNETVSLNTLATTQRTEHTENITRLGEIATRRERINALIGESRQLSQAATQAASENDQRRQRTLDDLEEKQQEVADAFEAVIERQEQFRSFFRERLPFAEGLGQLGTDLGELEENLILYNRLIATDAGQALSGQLANYRQQVAALDAQASERRAALEAVVQAADTQRSQVQRTLSGDLTEEDETQAQAALAEIDGRIAAARAELVAIPAKLDAAITQALQSSIRDQLTPQAQQLFDIDDFLERTSTGLNTTREGLQDRITEINDFFASIADQLDPYTMSVEEAIDFIIAKFAELNTGTTLDPQAISGFLDNENFIELRKNFDSIIEQIPAIQEAYDQQIIRAGRLAELQLNLTAELRNNVQQVVAGAESIGDAFDNMVDRFRESLIQLVFDSIFENFINRLQATIDEAQARTTDVTSAATRGLSLNQAIATAIGIPLSTATQAREELQRRGNDAALAGGGAPKAVIGSGEEGGPMIVNNNNFYGADPATVAEAQYQSNDTWLQTPQGRAFIESQASRE